MAVMRGTREGRTTYEDIDNGPADGRNLTVGIVAGRKDRKADVVVRDQTEDGRVETYITGFGVGVDDAAGVDVAVDRNRVSKNLPGCL
jgi:hypothetical protein